MFRKNDKLLYKTIQMQTMQSYGGHMSGYYTFLGDNLITQRSKKQNVVIRLSAELNFGQWYKQHMNCYG